MKTPSKCARLYPLRILSRKWSYMILRALRTPMTFAELQKELRFITNHILSRELKLLKEEGLIISRDKYLLTTAGKALYAASEPLVTWSTAHASIAPCSPETKCSTCLNYPETMGARDFVQLGKYHK